MIITYLRSSSYGSWDMCNFQYYMQYVLGWRTPSGKAADIGSMSHKAMELLAKKKLCFQNGTNSFYDDELKKEYLVESTEIDFLEASWEHYTKGPAKHHQWKIADEKKVFQNVYDFMNYKDGMYNPLKCDIIGCETYFDYEIDEPWAAYEYSDDKGNTIKGKLAIKGTMDLAVKHNDKVLNYVDWKGLPIDTPIPTPNGWSTMGDLKIGDELFDKDGKITKVLGKSQQSTKTCYKITFDDKTEAVCDHEHLWTLNDNSVVNVLDLKHKDKISVAKPLLLDKKELLIDPYVLGLWLGDGRNRGGEISKSDNFVFEEIQRRGYKVGEDIGGKDRCQSRTVYELVAKLKLLNLLHNKHIPKDYFRASFDQRLDLLRGLMDSDGNTNTVRKQAVFTSCSEKLSNDVKELLLTLGQRPNQCKTTQRGFGLTVSAYPVHFRPVNINPFLLPRKRDRIDKSWGPGKSNVRLIKKIEKIEDMVTQCIMVDSPTSTYLCTKNMIPTHNTGRRWDWGKDKPKNIDDLYNDFQVRLYHYALQKLFPEYSMYLMTFFYNNDGGPYHMALEKGDNDKVMKMMKDRFERIKNNKEPRRTLSWKCSKFCAFGKTLNKDSTYYNGKDNGKTICDNVYDQLQTLGLERLTNRFNGLGAASKYSGGGGMTDRGV